MNRKSILEAVRDVNEMPVCMLLIPVEDNEGYGQEKDEYLTLTHSEYAREMSRDRMWCDPHTGRSAWYLDEESEILTQIYWWERSRVRELVNEYNGQHTTRPIVAKFS